VTGVVVKDEWDRDARAFVFSTFANGYGKHSGVDSFGAFKSQVLEPFEAAVRVGRLRTFLVTLDGSPDDFVAWSAEFGDALVYVYVKQAFRGRGFGRMLLGGNAGPALTRVVYQTPAGIRLQKHVLGKVLMSAPGLLMGSDDKGARA
jgi:GNAT superfamily N-acetyltransferase